MLSKAPPLSRRPDPHCRRCPAWRGAKTVCVSGRGSRREYPAELDILFVGEMPGAEEDEQGVCFVGDAGAVFDSFAQYYLRDGRGRWRWSWELTNSIRCYLGRKPNGEYVKPWIGKNQEGPTPGCRPFLEREISRLRPRVIVPMGQYAIAQVLGVKPTDVKVAGVLCDELRSEWGVPVFPIHHPAWALREGISRTTGEGYGKDKWAVEWSKLVDWLEGKRTPFPGDWKWGGDMGREETEAFVSSTILGKDVAFDYETDGLSPVRHSFRMVGYSWEDGKAFVLPLREQWQLDLHRRVLSASPELYLHHWGMEMPWTLHRFGELPAGMMFDTKVLDFLTDENRSKKLADLVDLMLPELSGYKRKTEAAGVFEADDSLLAERCALDVIATRRIAAMLWSGLTGRQQELYTAEIEPFLRALAACKIRGWHFDLERLRSLRDRAEAEMERLRGIVMTVPEAQAMEADMNRNPRQRVRRLFNVRSNHHVPDLFRRMGIDDKEKVPRQPNDPSRCRVAREALEPIMDAHPAVKAVLEYRSMGQAISTFLDPIIEAVERDGCVYPEYNWGGQAQEGDPEGTGTGRLSCGRPNLANLPSPKNPDLPPLMREIRGCVVSRWEGGRILSADYSQGELRLMAMFSGEESLLSGYRREAEEGVPSDVHTDVARGLGIERHVAKTLNYVAAYFAAENQVAKQIGCGRKEAKDFLRKWWASKPRLAKWFASVKRRAYEDGWYEGVWGMRVHCPDIHSQEWKEREHAARRVGNYPVQNGLSMLLNACHGRLEIAMRRAGMESVIFGNLYDGLYIDVHPEEDETALRALVEDVLVRDPRKRYDWLLLPVPVDIKTGDRMGG